MSKKVQFTDTSINANTYYWEFGDGTTSTERNPMHTYGEYGTYTVYLTITDNIGNTDQVEQIIQLNNPNADNGEGELGSNLTEEIFGCMDPTATNYNSNATTDDGSCQYDVINEEEVVDETDDTQTDTQADDWPSFLSEQGINNLQDLEARFGTITAEFLEVMVENGSLTQEQSDIILQLVGLGSSDIGSTPPPPPPPTVTETTVTLTGILTRDFVENNVWRISNPSDSSLTGQLKAPQQISARAINAQGNPGQPLGTKTLTNALVVDNKVTLTPPISSAINEVSFMASITVVSSGDTSGGTSEEETGEGTTTVLGCTDPNAQNYNRFANVDDGSCTYGDDGGSYGGTGKP